MKRTLLFCLLWGISFTTFSQVFQNNTGGLVPDYGHEICLPVNVSGLATKIDSSFGIAKVCINISHEHVSSLVVRLQAPDGTFVKLSNQNGSYLEDYTNTCFSENASLLISNGNPPFTGTFVPEQSLNLMNNGQDPNGIWYLCVNDLMIANLGTVHNFSIEFNNNPPKDPPISFYPCGLINPQKCKCQDSTQTNCDLLPDITASSLIVQQEHLESLGLLKTSTGTPNIGWGPLEIRGSDSCYCDTVRVSCNTVQCPDGSHPKQLVIQKVYHKNNNNMTSYERLAGTMSYHDSHGHIHVDNWVHLTLRVPTPNPNPLTWPILGSGTKLSFCLVNIGDCSYDYGLCVDNNNNPITKSDLPNAPFGVVSGCDSVQGIFVGKIDIYDMMLPGQEMVLPGICNGDYYVVCEVDPGNSILESDETNNVIAVPIKLTQQKNKPDPSFSFNIQGNKVQFNAINIANQRYRWFFGDGNTDTTANPLHQYAQDGNYVVKLIVTGPCGVDSTQTMVPFISTFTGQYDVDFANIKAVPNPFKEETQILYTTHTHTAVLVELYDVQGRKLKTLENSMKQAGKHSLLISDVEMGMYILKFVTKEGFRMFKICKVN